MKGFKCPYCREIRPSRNYLATHIQGAHSDANPFRAVATAEEVGVPATAQDTTSERLAAARGEIRSLKETAEGVLSRLEALDAQATDPSVVRSKTLLDVMSMMIDSDNKAGYLTVLAMLKDEA